MADLMLGTSSGVTAVGDGSGKICEILADAANAFGVVAADLGKFKIPMAVTFRVKATGAVFGSTVRNVTVISNLGFITYDGADLALVPGTHAVYGTDIGVGVSSTGSFGRSNQNGGAGAGDGWDLVGLSDIESMRAALAAADGAYFTAARMNKMTYNDLLYACRVRFHPTTIK